MDPPQDPPQDSARDAQLQADSEWLQRIRARIKSPSPRNPNMSWESNDADLIERQLQDDRHRSWGFVIYRTTYTSDDDWAEFLRRLCFRMEAKFDRYNGRDILEKFALTVFEDRSLFDGASTDTIRRHFQQWSVSTYRTEQRLEGSEAGSGGGSSFRGIGRSPRYLFAIQVDAEALHSVVHDAPAPPWIDVTTNGCVKLIDKSWYLGRSERMLAGADPFEPIEGVTEEDVGWAKVPYQDVMTEWYTKCRSANNWGLNYRRPPVVMGHP